MTVPMDKILHSEQFFATDTELEDSRKRQIKANLIQKSVGPPLFQASSQVLAICSLGELLITAESAGFIHMIRYTTGELFKKVLGHKAPVTSLAAYDKHHFFSGAWDKTVKFWHVESSTPVKVLEGHTDFVKCVLCTNVNGVALVCSGSSDKSIRVVRLEDCSLNFKLLGHSRGVEGLQCLDTLLYSSSSDRTVKCWNLEDGSCVRTLIGHETNVYGLAIDLREFEIYSGSADNNVIRWHEGSIVSKLQHGSLVRTIIVNDRYVITGGRDQLIRVWDKQSWLCVHEFDGHVDEVSCLINFPDYKIVSGSYDGSVRRWDLKLISQKPKSTSKLDSVITTEGFGVISAEEMVELEELML
jgi:WD40 repeat protein